jgi:hypothetical protein
MSKERTRLPRGLTREAFTAHIDKINLDDLRYWKEIPKDVRLEIVAEANRLLAARNKPTLSEADMIYRIAKGVNNAIYRRVDWLPLKKGFVERTT